MISDDVRSILLFLSVYALGHYIGKLVAEIINEREIDKELERQKKERDNKHKEYEK